MKYRIKAIKNWHGNPVGEDYNKRNIYEFVVDGKLTQVIDDINLAYQGLKDVSETCPKGEYYVAEVKE